jgi:hypothetical protein
MSKTTCCTSYSNTETGTSNKGNLQEALDTAVATALRNAPGADRLVKWKLECVTGEQGGIAGINQLTVEISYEV